ncbi:MAG TPA: C-type lectin domain-containing protein [Polyangiaceae bacterium]|nr:C-type lectin domain-containing protein [Polyangiaceae bacterium]
MSIADPPPVARVSSGLLLPGLLFCLLAACSTRVDPTIAIESSDAGPSSDAGDAASECVELERGSSRYWICSGPLASHAAASDACQRRGAVLASVSSAEENAFLANSAANIATHSNLWLGGTRDDDHVWSWPDGSVFWRGLIDGEPADDAYVNWQSGEPNNTSTVLDEPERCAALALFDTGWRDRACSLELSYFCEAPLPAP